MTSEINYPGDCVLSMETALILRNSIREKSKRLVITNGCFDLLHRGHVEYLYRARKLGDFLLVLMNNDRSVRELKGPNRPVNQEIDRAFVLAGLASVDAVVFFEGSRCDKELQLLAPDIYVKGGDYTLETINSEEKQAVLSSGGKIEFISFVDGFSTTSALAKISNKN